METLFGVYATDDVSRPVRIVVAGEGYDATPEMVKDLILRLQRALTPNMPGFSVPVTEHSVMTAIPGWPKSEDCNDGHHNQCDRKYCECICHAAPEDEKFQSATIFLKNAREATVILSDTKKGRVQLRYETWGAYYLEHNEDLGNGCKAGFAIFCGNYEDMLDYLIKNVL